MIEFDRHRISWTLSRIHVLNWHFSVVVKGLEERGQGIPVAHGHLILRLSRLRFFNNVALDGDMVISFQRIGASMILEVINTLTFLSIHLHLIDLDKAFIMRVEPCKLLNRRLGNSFVEIMVSVKHLVGCHPA